MQRACTGVGLIFGAIGLLVAAPACGGSGGGGAADTTGTEGTTAGGTDGTGGSGGNAAAGGSSSSSTMGGAGDSGATTSSGGVTQTSAGGTDSSGGSGGTGGSGNDGGTTGDGGSGGGAGASGAGTGGTGGTVTTGDVATLGDPCDSPGDLACAGNYQKLTLVCGADGEWEVNQTCSGDQFCDSESGVNAGTCQDPMPECLDQEPGTEYCEGRSVMACGPDTVTVELVEDCTGVCEEGACNNAKDPCPTGDYANCADDCGGPVGCSTSFCDHEALVSVSEVPISVRLSAYEECAAWCDPLVFGTYLRLFAEAGDRVRITVADPWMIVADGSTTYNPDAPCEGEAIERCVVYELPASTSYVHVFTLDSDAQERNVTVELVDDDATCP